MNILTVSSKSSVSGQDTMQSIYVEDLITEIGKLLDRIKTKDNPDIYAFLEKEIEQLIDRPSRDSLTPKEQEFYKWSKQLVNTEGKVVKYISDKLMKLPSSLASDQQPRSLNQEPPKLNKEAAYGVPIPVHTSQQTQPTVDKGQSSGTSKPTKLAMNGFLDSLEHELQEREFDSSTTNGYGALPLNDVTPPSISQKKDVPPTECRPYEKFFKRLTSYEPSKVDDSEDGYSTLPALPSQYPPGYLNIPNLNASPPPTQYANNPNALSRKPNMPPAPPKDNDGYATLLLRSASNELPNTNNSQQSTYTSIPTASIGLHYAKVPPKKPVPSIPQPDVSPPKPNPSDKTPPNNPTEVEFGSIPSLPDKG